MNTTGGVTGGRCGQVEVRSAGSEPAGQINPVVVQAMREAGIDITAESPKILTPETVQDSDIVITMGCGDTCPVFPGKRYEDWDAAAPEAFGGGLDLTIPHSFGIGVGLLIGGIVLISIGIVLIVLGARARPGRRRRPFLSWQAGLSQTRAHRTRWARELDVGGGAHQTARPAGAPYRVPAAGTPVASWAVGEIQHPIVGPGR